MNTPAKMILKKVFDHRDGLLSPADLINGIAKRDRKSVEFLVTSNYIEEVPRDVNGRMVHFYRITPRGRTVFDPLHKKVWSSIAGDLRTIIVAVIASTVTSVSIILVSRLLS